MAGRIYREGFRITSDSGGVRIEAIDYHGRPLFLDPDGLRDLGLSLAGSRAAGAHGPDGDAAAGPPSAAAPAPPGRRRRFRWGWRRRPAS